MLKLNGGGHKTSLASHDPRRYDRILRFIRNDPVRLAQIGVTERSS